MAKNILVGLLAVIVVGCSDHPNITSEIDPAYIEIKREKYRLCHWKWSGIFPFEGGFIPDPHFYSTKPFDMPDQIVNQLGFKSVRFQGYDINPWFEDRTSEIILAIEIDSNVYEVKIENKEPYIMNYGFVNFYYPIVPFIYKNKVAFITGLDVSKLAILTVELPINKSRVVKPIFSEQPEFHNVIKYLNTLERFKVLREGLCGQYKPYRQLYEQFEKCPPLPKLKPMQNESLN